MSIGSFSMKVVRILSRRVLMQCGKLASSYLFSMLVSTNRGWQGFGASHNRLALWDGCGANDPRVVGRCNDRTFVRCYAEGDFDVRRSELVKTFRPGGESVPSTNFSMTCFAILMIRPIRLTN